MAKDFGNALSAATSIPANRTKPFTNTIGGEDRRDFLNVTLSSRSSLNATLSKFKGNVRLALLDGSGNVLQTATKSGKKKLINAVLDAGNYVFRLVGSPTGTTRYRLKIDSTPANTDPTVAANTGINLSRGNSANLSGSLLKVVDAQQAASQLVYTLTGKPTAGQLKLNGNLLREGSTFTQDDLDAGRVSYTSRGSINQLTQNAFDDGGEGNFAPSGEAIAWSGYDGSEYEVYFFDGSTTVPLTNNTTNEYVTGLSGNKVVWYGQGGTDGGTDYEIFLHDGSTIRQLTTNSVDDSNPQVSGSNVTWYGQGGTDGGTDYEIFFYDGSTVRQLTTNGTQDFNSQISGSNITWRGEGGSDGGTDSEIFFYNGTSVQQLTTNSFLDSNPQISGASIVWSGTGGSDGGTDYEIFFYNGTSTLQLTTNSGQDYSSQTFGSTASWYGEGGSDGGTDTEIFFYNGTSTLQLTTNTTNDLAPQLSGSNLVWYGAGGSDGGLDFEIFFYGNGSTRQLTQNSGYDYSPKIVGDLYAWFGQGGSDGGTDTELFYGSTVPSDRFSFTVSDGAGGSTAGSFVFSIT